MNKTEERHNLEINNYATISGVRGKQFGREIFSSVILFKDLMTFLSVFPEVQREVSERKVISIKRYVLSGLRDLRNNKKRKKIMRFFSSITVTARGNIFYNEEDQRLAIDTKNSKLSINDGQHRFYGINEAIGELNAMYNRAEDENERNTILADLDELKNMIIPIVIFNGIDETEEKQLFHDLNNLAQRPSRSATIRLAQTDLYSKLSRELAEHNKYLSSFGVEMDKMSIHRKNKNFILLTTIYFIVHELIDTEKETLSEDTYNSYREAINEVFDRIFESLPEDVNVKGKYLLERSYAFKGIVKFIVAAQKANIKDDVIYEAIKETDWTNKITTWSPYGATEGNSGILFAAGEGGAKAIYKSLSDKINLPTVSPKMGRPRV
ncbi:DNA sulfur modification protein DndB [Paenibacillus sp. 1182]|uniref:DNA sulfur modification protein DndB n=1 Tax=Paenibacillus sp. 1182 TaxID=2806565 RepID=UPI001AE38B73|nr:DNA sulfur modification protein DndB [Paenibacillus sp. 1182]MBP1309150.1 DNA sulfur modification protein DndB [Paenibacillus sp. 1182]